jgi:hypothetical protein
VGGVFVIGGRVPIGSIRTLVPLRRHSAAIRRPLACLPLSGTTSRSSGQRAARSCIAGSGR